MCSGRWGIRLADRRIEGEILNVPKMIIAVAPHTPNFGFALIFGNTAAGTRSKVCEWKRGFVLLTEAARAPILPAIFNYARKIVCFHPLISDVDDPARTCAAVQAVAATGAPRR